MYIYISAPHTFTCLTFTDLLSFDPFFYLFSLSSVPPSVPPPLCAGAPMPCAMYSLLFLKLLAFPPKSLLAHSYSTELLSKAPGSGGWTQNQRHQAWGLVGHGEQPAKRPSHNPLTVPPQAPPLPQHRAHRGAVAHTGLVGNWDASSPPATSFTEHSGCAGSSSFSLPLPK